MAIDGQIWGDDEYATRALENWRGRGFVAANGAVDADAATIAQFRDHKNQNVIDGDEA